MLSLRPANCNDIEKEYLFVRDIPADENGFINDYPDISREDFDSALDCLIANSSGEQLPVRVAYQRRSSYRLLYLPRKPRKRLCHRGTEADTGRST